MTFSIYSDIFLCKEDSKKDINLLRYYLNNCQYFYSLIAFKSSVTLISSGSITQNLLHI